MIDDVTGCVRAAPRALLRWEGAALFLALVTAYRTLSLQPDGPSWWMFALLLLAPDLSMLGYLAGPRMGALAYNALHTTLGPLLLGLAGLHLGMPVVTGIAVIWGAHIGLDRALGYGLKYPGAFRETHLGLLHAPRAGGARSDRR